MLSKNQNYTVDITDFNNLGFGVAKVDGISVFIADTVTGDRAEIRIIKTAKTYAVGTLQKLLVPSPIRCAEENVCPQTRRCGGCVYQRVTYEEELKLKRQYVSFAMKKAGLRDFTVAEPLTTGQLSHYRNKAQYPVGKGKDGETVFGFYAPKTHTVVPASDCSLQPQIFGEIAGAVVDFFDARHISVYNEETGRGVLRHIYLREARATGEIMLCLVINAEKLLCADDFTKEMTARFPQIVSVGISINKKQTNVILGDEYRTLWGKDYIEDILCGVRFRISPRSFYQVNHDATELLYGHAKKLLALSPTETVLDLYCGIGTIGLSVCEPTNRLIGIEIIPDAVKNARENAERNGFASAEFYCGDASDIARILADVHAHADAVIVDPPRKGLTAEVMDYIMALSPERVVYISCDPDTLARDLAYMSGRGYSFGELQPVDMFRGTGHVETVVKLERKDVKSKDYIEIGIDAEDYYRIKNKGINKF